MGASITILPTFSTKQTTPTNLIGPLASLYSQDNVLQFLHYPRDLSSSQRGHYVQFTIKKIKEITFDDVERFISSGFNSVTSAIRSDQQHEEYFTSTSSAPTSLKQFFSDAIASGQNMSFTLAEAKRLGIVASEAIQQLTRQSTETIGFVNLYMPETVNFSYQSQYNGLSLMQAVASTPYVPLVGKIASGINSIMENSAVKLLLNRAGYVFNPQQQLLFEGIDFRTFQMSFTFSPVSKEEADDVSRIIQMFRMYAAPQIVREAAGMFFVPPAVFEIDFLQNGKRNPNINRIETCVIDNIDVNYAPNGWAAHEDGQPVQTTLTISFKENVLIDRDKISQGY